MKPREGFGAFILGLLEKIADRLNDVVYALASRWNYFQCVKCRDWTGSLYEVCASCEADGSNASSSEQLDTIEQVLGFRIPEACITRNGAGMLIASIHDHHHLVMAPNWDSKTGEPVEGFILFEPGDGTNRKAYEGSWKEIVDRAELILRRELDEVIEDLSDEDQDILNERTLR